MMPPTERTLISYALRGVFHVLVGLALAIALLHLPGLWVSLALALITAIFLAFDILRLYVSTFNQRFLRWFAPLLREGEVATLSGSSYFLIGCMITMLAFPTHIAAAAILYLSLGDPAATLVGVWKGHIRIWGRSVEGHIACLVVCLLVGGVLVSTSADLALVVAFTGAFAATLIQALPLPVNDNLTIPLGSALAMTLAGIFT